jgi:hypothetical protein
MSRLDGVPKRTKRPQRKLTKQRRDESKGKKPKTRVITNNNIFRDKWQEANHYLQLCVTWTKEYKKSTETLKYRCVAVVKDSDGIIHLSDPETSFNKMIMSYKRLFKQVNKDQPTTTIEVKGKRIPILKDR